MTDPSTNPSPAWKFWHPLSFGRVVLIMLGAQLLATIVVVVLREVFSLPVPTAAAGAGGGILGILTITNRAAAEKAKQRPA